MSTYCAICDLDPREARAEIAQLREQLSAATRECEYLRSRLAEQVEVSRQLSEESNSPTFAEALETLINCHSKENGSDTPDFLLARYLVDCLDLWNRHVTAREKWYDRLPKSSSHPQPIKPTGEP